MSDHLARARMFASQADDGQARDSYRDQAARLATMHATIAVAEALTALTPPQGEVARLHVDIEAAE